MARRSGAFGRVASGERRAGDDRRSLARPRRHVSGSAMGIYGDAVRGARRDEPPRDGFLAEWQRMGGRDRARGPRRRTRRRRAHRLVLSPRGGALAKLLLPFRLGAGGRVGSGRQWVSWIALDDTIGAIVHAIGTRTLAGAVNLAAPNAVTNAELAATLGRVLRRPAVFPVPATALRLAFGEMGSATLLASQRMRRVGYSRAASCSSPTLEPAALRARASRSAR